MDPAKVMLSGFIGVALLYWTSGFSLYNSIVSSIFYYHINWSYTEKPYPILPVSIVSIAAISSGRFVSFQKICSLKLPAIGGASHA